MRSGSYSLVVLIAALGGPVDADESFTAVVTRVVDGDTVKIRTEDGRPEKTVRFLICDTPESNQPFGPQAKAFVEAMVLRKQVTIRAHGVDRWGRILGEVMIDGRSVNKALLDKGFAWWYYHYDRNAENGILEAKARATRRGLWGSNDAIPPWLWRKGVRIP